MNNFFPNNLSITTILHYGLNASNISNIYIKLELNEIKLKRQQ